MFDAPIFSFVIPYHNSARTIVATLRSIREQEIDDIEIIIIDDRSDEDERAVINSLARRDERVIVIDSPRPGPSAARNTGVAAARGRFISFLDADDCLRPGALSLYQAFFDCRSDVGVAFGQVCITPEPGAPGGVITPACSKPTLAQIVGENRICTTSNIVARREAFISIGSFNEKLTHAEDQEWLARAFFNAVWKLEGLSAVTLDYRTSPDGLSSDLKRMEKGWREMMHELAPYLQAASAKEVSSSRGLFYRYLARRALRLGTSRFAPIRFSLDALEAYPFIIAFEVSRTWATFIASVAAMLVGARTIQRFVR